MKIKTGYLLTISLGVVLTTGIFASFALGDLLFAISFTAMTIQFLAKN